MKKTSKVEKYIQDKYKKKEEKILSHTAMASACAIGNLNALHIPQNIQDHRNCF